MTGRGCGRRSPRRHTVHPRDSRYRVSQYERGQKTIFFPAKYEKYAEIVKLDTPENAIEAKEKLMSEFHDAETRDKHLRIMRATGLAISRARVMSNNKKLSIRERNEAGRIAGIYRQGLREMQSTYRRYYH